MRCTVAALFFLAACGGPGDQVMDNVFDACQPLVLVANDATHAERDGILAGAGMWNEVAGTQVGLEGDESAARLPVHFEDAAPGDWGLYDDERVEVLINSNLKDDHALAVVVAHELGHAFGLWHTDKDKRKSVMNAPNIEIEPNRGDAEAVAGLWGTCE